VITAWLLIAVALNVFVPQFEHVVRDKSSPFVPSDSASARGLTTMQAAFGAPGARGYALLVLAHPGGLTPADRAYQARLVTALRAAPDRVVAVQDDVTDPKLAPALRSPDGAAVYLSVAIRPEAGSPRAIRDVHWLRDTLRDARPPPGLATHVGGDVAMITDLTDDVLAVMLPVTVIAGVLILVILLGVYRRPRLMAIPLLTILVALLCARGLISLAGELGLPVSTYTDAFIVVVVFGAGTDYAVFLISRHQEYLAAGRAPGAAAAGALTALGPVLTASAATVMVGSAALATAQLAALHTLGPALALGIALTAAVAMTLTPALLVLAGPRAARVGGAASVRRWTATGRLLSRRPAAVLVVAVLSLAPLAALAPTVRTSVDENAMQPHSKNTRALAALNAHFPHHQTLPDYFVLTSATDLRSKKSLAAFARPAAALAAVPGVAVVQVPTKAARAQLVSADGHTARILVSGDANPLSPAGRDRLHAEQVALRRALAGSPLAGARVEYTGAAAFGADLHSLIRRDMQRVAVLVLIAVFAILVVVLRAVVAPLYLLASVVLSFAAALGITQLVWHDLMGYQIEWFLPLVTFVFLVAVGADYNLLLTARIREETPVGERAGIARAVVRTGGVITSAGLIFAGSFLALLPSSMKALAEVGFAIAVGLLLDTLVVRTLIVPAAAMLLGPWNWWPRRPQSDAARTAGQGRSSAAGAPAGTTGERGRTGSSRT
jgi:uncharacterized membrane protein YdfJ with MMPL/SSD domain